MTLIDVKLIFIVTVIFSILTGIILRKYIKTKKIIPYSNSWVNLNMLVLFLLSIFISIIYYIIFNKKYDLSQIIVAGILFVAVYIYFRIVVPKYLLNSAPNIKKIPLTPFKILLLSLLVFLMIIMMIFYIATILRIFLYQSLSLNIITFDLILLACTILVGYFMKRAK